MNANTWTVAEAEAKLNEVIERAQIAGPQAITRNGIKVVVVVATDEWERKSRRKTNLAEFFAGSPLRDSGIEIERILDRHRAIDV